MTFSLCGHVTNQKSFIFIFRRHKVHKLIRVMTRMRIPRLTCHMAPRSHRHVTTIQYVVFICATSSLYRFNMFIFLNFISQLYPFESKEASIFVGKHKFLSNQTKRQILSSLCCILVLVVATPKFNKITCSVHLFQFQFLTFQYVYLPEFCFPVVPVSKFSFCCVLVLVVATTKLMQVKHLNRRKRQF